jgi:cell division protein ZapE
MPHSVATRYAALVRSGQIEADRAQQDAVARLDALQARLMERRLARKSSALGWLFHKNAPQEPTRGLYIWGSVGRGKTMLMDLFFERLPVQRKRRAHFHMFMADVHERIHLRRLALKAGTVKGDDPIAPVAKALAEEAWVLCFDEFAVRDIADAMLLGRLFEALFREGVVVVATSNVEPGDLYADGLNRALFLPFIDLLMDHMEVLELDARTDYRLEKLEGVQTFHVPADASARAALDAAFHRLTGGAPPVPAALAVKGRRLEVPAACAGVARFSFDELCARPLGAGDYLAIALAYHTVILDGIPAMDAARRNDAKRFITLIDILYEQNVKLIASADAEPESLYRAANGTEAFEFARTRSRLMEMRSAEYLATAHGRSARGDAASAGIVDT